MLPSESEDSEFFKRIAIIGLGLLGGSLAKSLRLKGYKDALYGYDTNQETLIQAKTSGLFTQLESAPASTSPKADLILIAVPLSQIQSAMKLALILVDPGTVIMDVGSVKGTVHAIAESLLEGTGAVFVGGHPMAGSERGGFNAGSPILFENAYFFLTLDPQTPLSFELNKTIDRLKQFVFRLGALPVMTDPKAHDALAARLSHLPHLTAAALVNVFAATQPVDQLKFAGGGFRDTTRIAMGDPSLWTDIFLHNRAQVIESIDDFIHSLNAFKMQLLTLDDTELSTTLEDAKKMRFSLITRRPSEEVSLYPLRLELEDRPGILAEVTRLLADHQLDIKDLALDHARENQRGAFTLSFASDRDRNTASALLKASGLGLGTIDHD